MIGIYGGTFDPIHYGHLRTALEVKEAAGLDEIRFIPCRHPPHRQQPQASSAQRLRMLELALMQAEPGFRIDARELHRDGPSYMVDTLSTLRSDVGDTPLCLILGLDAFRGLPAWHRWLRLFDLAHIIVMQRPRIEPEWPQALTREVAHRLTTNPLDLRQQAAGRVMTLDVVQLDISATRIRQMQTEARSARYLLPDAVLDYIHSEGLYAQAPMGYF